MANSLYLDTNVYLSFYHLSNDDLDELSKLSILVKSKKLVLHLPEQTKNEFTRNRDTKIADALKRFNENKLHDVFPQFTKDYEDEYKSMVSAIKTYEKSKQSILSKIKIDINKKELKADKIIKQLFSYANFISTDIDLLNRAKERFDLGNPPGKKNSYGDALNWESLLSVVEDFDSFHFISSDSDYYSELDKESFNSYLLEEWEKKMPFTDFKHYKSLSRFLRENYPAITIATEENKEKLIDRLVKSYSFSESRSVLRELVGISDFSEDQANDILKAAINNNQLHWISGDEDIREYLHTILNVHLGQLNAEDVRQFKDLYESSEEEDALPF